LLLGTQGGEKDGLDYAAESRQLHRIGGDCFDCLKLSEDRFGPTPEWPTICSASRSQ